MLYSIRQMNVRDVDAVLMLQQRVYISELLEDAEFFINRLAIAAQHCWVAVNTTHLLGYLISYPWIQDVPPALNDTLLSLPSKTTSWFVHDCAVAPEAQGLGVSTALLKQGKKIAKQNGFTHSHLIALGPAVSYWRYRGYTPILARTGERNNKLDDYGTGACHMEKNLV